MGIKERDKAFNAIVGMLRPEAVAGARYLIENSPTDFRQNGDSFILDTCICCDYQLQEHYWCPCDSNTCVLIGPGCPA